MPVYEYNALTKEGKKINGFLDAKNASEAKKKLREQQSFPISIQESTGKKRFVSVQTLLRNPFTHLHAAEIANFTRQLATLINAGVPLNQSLSLLVHQTENPQLKRIISNIRDSINEGISFGAALTTHPTVFSSVYINMILAGEASGSLGIVLEQLAEYSEKQLALKEKIKAALVYPAFMAVFGSAILLLLLTYVVPNITEVFNDMDKALPLPTVFLIKTSSFFQHFWWAVLVCLFLLLYSLHHYFNTKKGRILRDTIKLKAPIFGTLMHKIILSRFASTLGSLLKSGVDLVNALQIVRAITSNIHIAQIIDDAIEEVKRGKSMTAALSLSPWFPPLLTQMVQVGEQSGELEQMLIKVASAYERDVETTTLKLSSLVEPVMISIMGLIVLFIVLSILLPIFDMNQLAG